MRRIIFVFTIAILLLSACSAAAPEQPTTDESGSTIVTVYRAPT